MEDNLFSLEDFWEGLLSRDETKIRRAFASLPENERPAVLAHLRRMASEPDWHPEQRCSAEAALQALDQV